MKNIKALLIGLTAIAVFFLVYQIHWSYHLPYHVDEWHHITEGIRVGNYGEYLMDYTAKGLSDGFSGTEFGFHIFLFIISWFTNLINIYQFLPAIWAAIGSLIIFFVTYKKSESFFVGWLSMLFFASIKSNVNLMGIWFFTPLSFAIPFIYLFFYLFTEGLEKRNRKYLLGSIAVMILLCLTHAISFLFALPILLIVSAVNYKYIIKKIKFFSLFLLVPLAGLIFYKLTLALTWSELLSHLSSQIIFKLGWGVLERQNQPTELYSLAGYALAFIGLAIAFVIKGESKKYLAYLIWPLWLLAEIVFYRLTSFSPLAPYQRNFYYFVLGLPFLSALGASYIWRGVKFYIGKTPLSEIEKKYAKILFMIIFIPVIILFAFKDYYKTEKAVSLYKLVSDKDISTLNYLKGLPKGKVMATPFISTTLYPMSGHKPIGTLVFYGDPEIVNQFFMVEDCAFRQNIINQHKIDYVISKWNMGCGWKTLYNKDDYIYDTSISQ